MEGNTFIKGLSLSVILSIIFHYLINLAVPVSAHISVLWYSVLFYTIHAVVIYMLVRRSMEKNGGNGIISLVMFNVLIKLVFTFGFAAAYVKLSNPSDKFFLIPLLITYLVFTVFETWFLNLQARDVR